MIRFYSVPAPVPNCTTANRAFVIHASSNAFAFSTSSASMPHPSSAFSVRRAHTGQGK